MSSATTPTPSTTPAAPAGFVYLRPAQDRVIFDRPAGEAVSDEVTRLGAKRVFIVSSRSLARKVDGPLQRVQKALGDRLVGTYGTVRAHSPREDIVEAAQAASRLKADLLVAVGGGSVIDATKAIAMCLWCGIETPAQMENFRVVDGKSTLRITPPPRPIRIVSVSTTLSAAEFTWQAGVTDTATKSKQSFSHPLMVPISAVLDPRATLDTPLRLLLGTGMRAVDHAIESYCSPQSNPASEAHSMHGLHLLSQALPSIRRHQMQLDARLLAQLGMWQAITACAAGVVTGASHGIGYALGATLDVPHGETSCVLLPAVLRWNAAVNADRQAPLAAAMGAPGQELGDLVAKLVQDLNLPTSLKALGVAPDQFADIARRSMAYLPVKANPRPIQGESDVLEILQLAAG